MTLYIDPVQNPSGAYPNPKLQPFDGCIQLTDEQSETFLQYNGFVIVTTDPQKELLLHYLGAVIPASEAVTVTPNTELWEAWKASLPPDPDPEPTTEERVEELEEALNMILSGVTE